MAFARSIAHTKEIMRRNIFYLRRAVLRHRGCERVMLIVSAEENVAVR